MREIGDEDPIGSLEIFWDIIMEMVEINV